MSTKKSSKALTKLQTVPPRERYGNAAIDQTRLRPYLSAMFLRSLTKGLVDAALADALLDEAVNAIPTPVGVALAVGSPTRVIVSAEAASLQEKLNVGTLVYAEESVPSWYAGTSLTDRTNHLLVIAVSGNTAAVICSDPAMRDAIAKCSKVAQPIAASVIADAFVGSAAKTLWLSGVHASTSVKADSKTLSGSALENALDPIGDQSYALSAIRSQPIVKGLAAGKRPAVIGAAPAASRVWLNRPADWTTFLRQTKTLLAHLKKRKKPVELYDFLSKPVRSLTDVSGAHSLAVLPAAMLAEDASAAAHDQKEAIRWAYDASYAVQAVGGADFDVDVLCRGIDVGTAAVKVSTNADGRVRLSVKWARKGAAPDTDRRACAAFLSDPAQVKIYYDSGHAIADGHCFLAGWTDHVLSWEFLDLSSYHLWQEKPDLSNGLQLADAIDQPVTGNKSSLFTFVQQELCHNGWLACDDGAMELADFVHLDKKGAITLIHVKGAGTRDGFSELSVSDFEVVVSQGVKNIRHLTPQKLADELEAGAGKKIARAIWLDGKREANRTAMIKAIRALPASAPRTLLILQPRLTGKEYEHCINNASSNSVRVKRFKQLNALMLGARVAAMGAGAEFRAIGAK